MEYEVFIKQLNDLQIKEMTFNVNNYKHYNNCQLIVEKTNNDKYSLAIFYFKLTKDKCEQVEFYKKYDENAKIFTYKNKGKFSLKEIWKHIEIINIIYY